MKLKKLIEVAKLNSEEFKEVAEFTVILYDRKGRRVEEEYVDQELNYPLGIFAHNPDSKKLFEAFLKELKNNSIKEFNVQNNDHALILFYKNPGSIILFKQPRPDPIDRE